MTLSQDSSQTADREGVKKETRNSLPATSCRSVSCLQKKYNFKHQTDLPGQPGARQSTEHHLFCSHSERHRPGPQPAAGRSAHPRAKAGTR